MIYLPRAVRECIGAYRWGSERLVRNARVYTDRDLPEDEDYFDRSQDLFQNGQVTLSQLAGIFAAVARHPIATAIVKYHTRPEEQQTQPRHSS